MRSIDTVGETSRKYEVYATLDDIITWLFLTTFSGLQTSFNALCTNSSSDENYGRENLQLHQIGLVKLNEDGSPKLDRFGKQISNYNQEVSH